MRTVHAAALFAGKVLLAIGVSLWAQSPGAGWSANQLAEAAKNARKAGNLQSESDSLCQAALLDPAKYAKRCDKAKEELAHALTGFAADFSQARSELQHKDYAGAVRDSSKITFGPQRDAAAALSMEARVAGQMVPPQQASQLAWQLASAAYANGELDAAEAWLKYVTVPGLQPQQMQMRTNIRVYRETMEQATQLEARRDWDGAAGKYSFAANIVANGPGSPKERLREVQAEQAAAERAYGHPAPQAQLPSQEESNLQKLAALLQTARAAEARADWSGAATAYAAALALDPKQKDAKAGRKRALAKMSEDTGALERLVVQGVTQFYAAHYEQSRDTLAEYLQKGGTARAGAAHFYLGASFAALEGWSDPKDTERAKMLREQARKQFAAARALHYAPLEEAVSPRLLEQWARAGDAE